MKRIKLGKRDLYTIVDDEDFEWVSQWKWHTYVNPIDFRVVRKEKDKCGKWTKSILLHRIIMKAKLGQEVDHINGDSLDNRRCNLRLCTSAQNKYNKHIIKSKTGYKGVYFSKCKKNKYYAQIMINNKGIHLGMFNNLIEAAKSYNKAANKYFGEFSCVNNLY